MTGPATFGDFAEAARSRLAALPAGGERPNPDIVAGHVWDYTYGLHRILRIMIRYTADLASSPQLDGSPDAGSANWWAQAAAEAWRALQGAYRYSPLLRAPKKVRGARPTSPLSRQLAAVAEAMVIGRDLLQTHFTTDLDRVRVPRTEWSAVIDSAAVRRAVLTELGGWAREIAARTTSLTIAPTMNIAWAEIDQQRLTAMHRGFADAAAAIETAHDRAPIHQRDLEQLHAIPVSIPSPSRQPTGSETIADLCQRITSTAERVRRAFAATASEAAWSPELTAASLRQTAAMTAVISHHCQLIHQILATQAADLGMSRQAPGFRVAARAEGQAERAWLRAVHSWRSIETDAPKGTPSFISEVAALVAWTGRLAHNDPDWKPGMRIASPVRPATSLAPTSADLGLAAKAVREATATMVAIAAADYTRVRTAAQAGRLLTPVEALYASPEPFLFTRISRYQATSLLEAYRDAGTTSVEAHAATGRIADQIHDRNLRIIEQEHAKAAEAARRQIPGWRSRREPDPLSPAGRAELKAGRDMPGPVERKLLELGVTNPESLTRGKEIDQAASQLIDQAAQETASLRWNAAVTGRKLAVNPNELVDDVLARSQRERDAPSVTQSAGVSRSKPHAEADSWQAEP